MKQLGIVTFWLFVCAGASSQIFAQRKAVSGAEVTGTFRSYFTGKFKDSYNEILIQALGGNKLKIEMKLVHPYQASAGISVNVGSASGEAVIHGDRAIFTPGNDATDSNSCKITLVFSKPGALNVTTENNSNCGFGHNVSADGTYKKTSGAKPKFGEDSFGYIEPPARQAVSGAEVTGTFRTYFKGEIRSSYNEILIQALGGNKLKIEMKLIYPYKIRGQWTANFGDASGEAMINGDTAVFMPVSNESCKITLKFSRPGTLVVTSQTTGSFACGFGHNVSADGAYKKTSGVKPKFGQ